MPTAPCIQATDCSKPIRAPFVSLKLNTQSSKESKRLLISFQHWRRWLQTHKARCGNDAPGFAQMAQRHRDLVSTCSAALCVGMAVGTEMGTHHRLRSSQTSISSNEAAALPIITSTFSPSHYPLGPPPRPKRWRMAKT